MKMGISSHLIFFISFSLLLQLSLQDDKSTCGRDRASDQLCQYKKNNPKPQRATNLFGCPVQSLTASQSVGERGPLLLQDTNLLEHLAHFDRERIPERVVHAKGGGAFGHFEVTHDITSFTKAKVFSNIGKKTPILMRFSTVGGESGSADTARDPRGFAVKFYTEDGNWDLVGNNIPIFFIRDPILFPSFIHTQKRNPQTHLKDKDMFWDFLSLRPESLHQTAFLFSDRGIPDGYRHMHGYGSHTFKFVNKMGNPVYVKFHMKTNQGIRNIMNDNATMIAGTNPDHAVQDLYNAIESKNFPSWTMYVQIMTYEQAEKYKFNPFDLTKVWLHADFPLKPVGKLTLERNPVNYFSEIEQAAFAPANFIPGIEASPDKMLQGRLFSYIDTHRHRVGANYELLPVNAPKMDFGHKHHYERAGAMNIQGTRAGNGPNYFPNSFNGPYVDEEAYGNMMNDTVKGDVMRKDTGDEDNFTQVKLFWTKVLKEDERERLVQNMGNHVKGATKEIQERLIANYMNVDKEWGTRLKAVVFSTKRSG